MDRDSLTLRSIEFISILRSMDQDNLTLRSRWIEIRSCHYFLFSSSSPVLHCIVCPIIRGSCHVLSFLSPVKKLFSCHLGQSLYQEKSINIDQDQVNLINQSRHRVVTRSLYRFCGLKATKLKRRKSSSYVSGIVEEKGICG